MCCNAVHCTACAPHPVFHVLEIYQLGIKYVAGATEFYELLLLLHKRVAHTRLALLQIPDHLLTLYHLLKTYTLSVRYLSSMRQAEMQNPHVLPCVCHGSWTTGPV